MNMDMGSSSTASSTMGVDMGSSMSMAMTSATSSSTAESMDMSGMSMHMYFTTNYIDYPVLFKSLSASNKGQAFGIFLLLFCVAFLTRGIEFLRNYLEQEVWKNPTYVDCHPAASALPVQNENTKGGCCTSNELSTDSIAKDSSSSAVDRSPVEESINKNGIPLASTIFRDIIRLALCILPDLFGFALMLAVMTFTLTYFFAVVLGLGIGRFFFERLTDHYRLRPINLERLHC